jgi:nucleoside-diphosphate-sugar epimerase
MKAVITGGGGFLGSRLAAALRARDAKADITLVDVAFPPGLEAKYHCIAGDVASPEVIGRALDGDTESIFHLAAVVSGGAEADFDLGYHVNMDGTRAAGSVPQAREAAEGRVRELGGGVRRRDAGGAGRLDHAGAADFLRHAEGDRRVPDRRLHAQGIHRRALASPADHRRAPGQAQPRGVVVRKRHHPRAAGGVVTECPVSDATGVWILSPRRVVEAFMHAHDLQSSAWPTTRVVNLPGITLSVRQMIDAMGRVAGRETVDRVKFVPDARIQGIVKTWPVRFRTDRALAMGFRADDDFESIVKDHLATA